MTKSDVAPHRPDRRAFLALGAAALGGLSPTVVSAHGAAPRALLLYHLHTTERVKTVYWADGRYLADGLDEIERFLRDWRTEEVSPVDVRLLDLMHDLRGTMGGKKPFHVVSGYRSPATNEMLAKHGKRVARNSLHMQGRAVDVLLPGHDLGSLRRAAVELRRGGVGYYPRSGFIHLDVGPVRYW